MWPFKKKEYDYLDCLELLEIAFKYKEDIFEDINPLINAYRKLEKEFKLVEVGIDSWFNYELKKYEFNKKFKKLAIDYISDNESFYINNDLSITCFKNDLASFIFRNVISRINPVDSLGLC